MYLFGFEKLDVRLEQPIANWAKPRSAVLRSWRNIHGVAREL